jgi:hypothetical protein
LTFHQSFDNEILAPLNIASRQLHCIPSIYKHSNFFNVFLTYDITQGSWIKPFLLTIIYFLLGVGLNIYVYVYDVIYDMYMYMIR